MTYDMHYIAAERTIVQISEGNGYTPLMDIRKVSLPLDPHVALTIDGVRWAVVRRAVDVDTDKRTITTTITVVRYAEN